MELMEREKGITRTGLVGIAANLGLAALKAVIGILAGSLAVILDAVNNLSDSVSSIITILGIKLAKKKPTDKHPYGFGRIEYFSSVIIASIILATGVISAVESVKKIITPSETDASWITIVILASAVLVKILLGLFTRKQGRKYNSEALKASGTDAMFDAITSALTIAGIGVYLIWHVNIDGYIGCVLCLIILKTAIEMLLESVSDMLGTRPDAELTKEIKEYIRTFKGVDGAYDLIIHNYGPDYAIGSVHVEIPSTMSVNELHTLSQRIMNSVYAKFHLFLTVGIYSIDENKRTDYEKVKAQVLEYDNVIGFHGFYVNDEDKIMSFDVLTDFMVKDYKKLCIDIRKRIAQDYPEYNIIIKFDKNYSD